MKLDQYDSVYFLGIGGIGMSALARWFLKKGLAVSGYDRTATTLTEALAAEGMAIHYEDAVANIPDAVRAGRERTLVIYTPAIPKDHAEYNYLKAELYTLMKRSEVLGLISKDYKTVAVAGTHGKTTTSSMIAHIIKESGKDMVAFLGGIATNYESNLVMQGEIHDDTIVVTEADEFDRSFLRLFPDIAVVTSADADHLDIYGDHQSLITSFNDFMNQVRPGGTLIINQAIADQFTEKRTHIQTNIYGMSRGQFFASSITVVAGFFEFNLHGLPSVEKIKLGVPGFHNVENAVAAAAAAHLCGVTGAEIARAMASFRGVKRRFEIVVQDERVLYVDDYAHHPTEIEAFLKSMKALCPERKLTVVFQPHLYTRTRDFAEGFAKSLSLADELLLMDIYPARELPIPGVNADMIFKDVTSPVKIRCGKNDLLQKLETMEIDVLVTVGAGDIDTFVKPIKELLLRRHAKV